MKPLHAAHACLALFATVLALCPTTACQTKVEDSDVFKTQVDRIDRSEKDVDAMQRRLTVIDRDLQQVSLDVSSLLKNGGGNPQAVSALEQRILKLETSLKTAGETVAAFDGRIARLEKATEPAGARVAALDHPAPGSAPVDKKTTLVVSRKDDSVKPGAAPARVAAKPESPHGVYHQVGLGETLDQIARAYKVPVSSIQAANQLPSGRMLVAGQKLYVPHRR